MNTRLSLVHPRAHVSFGEKQAFEAVLSIAPVLSGLLYTELMAILLFTEREINPKRRACDRFVRTNGYSDPILRKNKPHARPIYRGNSRDDLATSCLMLAIPTSSSGSSFGRARQIVPWFNNAK